jgi:hypothetical protein
MSQMYFAEELNPDDLCKLQNESPKKGFHLGSRLIHSQKATMMARATPERKLSASLS